MREKQENVVGDGSTTKFFLLHNKSHYIRKMISVFQINFAAGKNSLRNNATQMMLYVGAVVLFSSHAMYKEEETSEYLKAEFRKHTTLLFQRALTLERWI